MIETLTIALWSHLFCGPWSESGKVFGWLKNWAYKSDLCTGKQVIPNWVVMPAIGCAMCHAVWASMIVHVWHVAHGAEVGIGNVLQVLCASFVALLLDDFAIIRDKWKNL